MSLHRIAAPTYLQLLDSMQTLLDKAIAHCEARNIEQGVVLQSRLYPDMFSLVRQVQAVADHAASSCLRLSGRESLTPPRDESTFQALKQRVAHARSIVESVNAEAMDVHADREISFPIGQREAVMKGWDYLVHFALPNFYFHHAMAYAILRHNGVEVGKRDFLGAVPGFRLQ